jgi:tetratricopeptide (TPR) repeat protein
MAINIFIFALGLASFLTGLAFFYSPRWILWMNRLAREWVFNDNFVVAERNHRAVFFLLTGLFFFSWGYQRERSSHKPLEPIVSNSGLLYQSLQALQSKDYPAAKEICQRILSRDPRNAEAMYQLGAAEFLMKNIEGGRMIWNQAVEADPRFAKASYLRNLVLRDKSPELPDPGFEVQ